MKRQTKDQMQFVVVKKITRDEKKTADGTVVKDAKNKTILDAPKIVTETIRLDEVKSIRPWHKSAYDKNHIKGDITMLYMHGDRDKSKPAQILIEENHDSFCMRIGAVML